jgi:hypothetical protein
MASDVGSGRGKEVECRRNQVLYRRNPVFGRRNRALFRRVRAGHRRNPVGSCRETESRCWRGRGVGPSEGKAQGDGLHERVQDRKTDIQTRSMRKLRRRQLRMSEECPIPRETRANPEHKPRIKVSGRSTRFSEGLSQFYCTQELTRAEFDRSIIQSNFIQRESQLKIGRGALEV